ncbi:MAG: hypothetical protein V4727_07160 [Verrucomicrobiota bacterium]
MKKIILLAGASLVIFIPLGMWWFSEERVVKRRSDHLMDVLTISAETGGVMRYAKALSINGVLAPEFEIESTTVKAANGTFPSHQIESAYSWICSNTSESEFEITEFRDVKIEGNRATVIATVEGFIDIKGDRPVDGTSDVTLYFQKTDGSWLLTKVIWN